MTFDQIWCQIKIIIIYNTILSTDIDSSMWNFVQHLKLPFLVSAFKVIFQVNKIVDRSLSILIEKWRSVFECRWLCHRHLFIWHCTLNIVDRLNMFCLFDNVKKRNIRANFLLIFDWHCTWFVGVAAAADEHIHTKTSYTFRL